MHPKAEKALLDKVQKLAQNMSPDGHAKSKLATFYKKPYGFSFVDEDRELFEAVVKQLVQLDAEKFSYGYIEDMLRDIFFAAIEEDSLDGVEKSLHQLIEHIENYKTEQVVYVPLDGVDIPGKQVVDIGNISLKKMDDERLKPLIDQVIEVISNTANTSEEKAWMMENQTEKLRGSLLSRVCSEFHIVAEPVKAREIAEAETRKVIDIFRYAIPEISKKSEDVAIGLQGEALIGIRHTAILTQDNKEFIYGQQVVGPHMPFVLSQDNLARMEKIGVFKLGDFLKTETEKDSFARTLLRGIHWFASSQDHSERANCWLNLITCFETFFSTSTEPVAATIAESVALIIADNLQDRQQIVDELKAAYGVRNDIAHGREVNIDDQKLRRLEGIAGVLLNTLVSRVDDFEKRDNLLNWLREKRLSA